MVGRFAWSGASLGRALCLVGRRRSLLGRALRLIKLRELCSRPIKELQLRPTKGDSPPDKGSFAPAR